MAILTSWTRSRCTCTPANGGHGCASIHREKFKPARRA